MRKRQRDAQRETLEALRFIEGQRPSDKTRQAVREAVASGQIEVPEDGFDAGTPWRWYPGGVPSFSMKDYAVRAGLVKAPVPGETFEQSELRRHGNFAASRAALRKVAEKAA
jgi:hypothetical protein